MEADQSSSSSPDRIWAGLRLWLHDRGKPVYGPGTQRLLLLVAETGSLHQSAQRMRMSYSKAWRIVREAEEHLGVQLLERHAGGPAGGGSVLTPDGRLLVERFGAFKSDLHVALEVLYAKYFGDVPFAHGERPDDPTRPDEPTGLDDPTRPAEPTE